MLTIFGQGLVSAYYLTMDAPSEVRVGQPFNITGVTNIPPPDKVDVVFSQSINIPVEVARHSIQITEKGENSFNVTFETTGLEKGNYKVEALSQTQRDFSAGSRNLRVVKLIDRSDIIRFSSPQYQEFTGDLVIEARIQDYADNSIQLEIKKGEKTVFGPESVPVSKSLVKYELPITEQGGYSIIFNDYKGYIGSYPVQVVEETEKPIKIPSPTPSITESNPVVDKPTEKATEEPTKKPTTTQIQETVKVVPTDVVTLQPESVGKNISPSGTDVALTTQVSRDSPGYFVVLVKKTPVTIKTSANADWVLEYKTTPTAALVKVNEKMKEAAEEATITTDTKEIYLKVYPYSYKTGEEVTVTASNADAVRLSDDAAKVFGAPPRYGIQNTSSTGKSPAPIAGLILGIIGAAWITRRK